MTGELHEMGLAAAAHAIRNGELSSEAYAGALLERARRHADLKAFITIDEGSLMEAAARQEKTFERVGGNETIHTDVRVIASTHRDLAAWSLQERFRQDLYYRLRVFTIHLPPLRERGDDIALLARHFVRRFARELRRDVREIDPSTLRRLAGHSWPGNVRELQSVLKQAILHATGTVLLPDHFPNLAPPRSAPMVHGREGDFSLAGFIREQLDISAGDVYAATHRQVDRFLVQATLQFVNGNMSGAARVLGISRETLRTRIQALGMQMRRSLEDEDEDAHARLAS